MLFRSPSIPSHILPSQSLIPPSTRFCSVESVGKYPAASSFAAPPCRFPSLARSPASAGKQMHYPASWTAGYLLNTQLEPAKPVATREARRIARFSSRTGRLKRRATSSSPYARFPLVPILLVGIASPLTESTLPASRFRLPASKSTPSS